MIGQILAILKGFAVALGWAKQAADQKTGAEIVTGQQAKEALAEAQRIRDARDSDAELDRVRKHSFRDSE